MRILYVFLTPPDEEAEDLQRHREAWLNYLHTTLVLLHLRITAYAIHHSWTIRWFIVGGNDTNYTTFVASTINSLHRGETPLFLKVLPETEFEGWLDRNEQALLPIPMDRKVVFSMGTSSISIPGGDSSFNVLELFPPDFIRNEEPMLISDPGLAVRKLDENRPKAPENPYSFLPYIEPRSHRIYPTMSLDNFQRLMPLWKSPLS